MILGQPSFVRTPWCALRALWGIPTFKGVCVRFTLELCYLHSLSLHRQLTIPPAP
jgi:hypothetical protein